MERMERLIKVVFLLLLLPSLVWGAELIFSENFDGRPSQEDIYPFIYRKYGAQATTPTDYTWATGRGGSGYSYASTGAACWIEWGPGIGGNAIGTWPTNEVYGSMWIRFPNGFSGDIYKQFYWHFSDDAVEYDVSSANGFFWETYANSGYEGSGWTTYSIGTDWHHLEMYINFTSHVIKAWIDRPAGDYTSEATTTSTGTYLKLYRVISAWDSNALTTINFGVFQNGGGNALKYIDDVELWDGIPDSTPAPAPPTLSNVTISGGSFR